MAVWNLTEFSELEDRVLTAYEVTPSRARSNGKRISRMGRVLAMATAATVFTVADVGATHGSFSAPVSVVAFAQSGIAQRPPLNDFFAGRFDRYLSAEREDTLLIQLEAGRMALSKTELQAQAVETIFYNQQEDAYPDADRLSREEIEKIVKHRKLV